MSNNKFESLLELLINEENDKAEALFHEIVVEKQTKKLLLKRCMTKK